MCQRHIYRYTNCGHAADPAVNRDRYPESNRPSGSKDPSLNRDLTHPGLGYRSPCKTALALAQLDTRFHKIVWCAEPEAPEKTKAADKLKIAKDYDEVMLKGCCPTCLRNSDVFTTPAMAAYLSQDRDWVFLPKTSRRKKSSQKEEFQDDLASAKKRGKRVEFDDFGARVGRRKWTTVGS